MIECWKDVPGFDGAYQISNLGRVRSTERVVRHPCGGDKHIRERILKQCLSATGYPVVTLCKAGEKNKVYKVHRLVANAFLANPSNYPTVNHLDGNKCNPSAQNLEWCSPRQNTHHACEVLGTQGKLTRRLAAEIREMHGTGYYSHRKLAAMYGISHTTVGKVVRGETWRKGEDG